MATERHKRAWEERTSRNKCTNLSTIVCQKISKNTDYKQGLENSERIIIESG